MEIAAVSTEETAIEVLRDGKDEMNLVEHPFALLNLGINKGTVIDLAWEQRHPHTNKIVKSSWKVIGHPELGLPGPLEEKLYLVMMKLTREAGMEQIVHFSRGDLVTALGWSLCPQSYRQLEDAFSRLGSVLIETRNSFWNASTKNFDALSKFALIDNVNIAVEKPGPRPQGQLPFSSWRWNDVIFRSMSNGHLRSLDTAFALSLQLPLSLRLFRYLDKKRHNGLPVYEIDLRRLCELHLGMKTNPYLSKYKERLSAAHEELLAKGFLHGVSYAPLKTRKGEKVRYAFQAPALEASPVENLPGEIQFQKADSGLPPEQALLQRMLAIKMSPAVADELLRTCDHDLLQKQLDCLPDRDAKNPAAVFIKAVREAWDLPSSYISRLKAQERAQNEREAVRDEEAAKTSQRARKAALQASQNEEAARLDAAYAKLDERNRSRVDEEATSRLGIVGQLRSSEGAKAAMRRQVVRQLLQSGSVAIVNLEKSC